jgi:serine/threonine protein kinase/Flp pilus assembly protein TadD
MELEAGRVLNHYRLGRKLGQGGMGIVWQARDLKLERDVAVKFLPEGPAFDPDRRASFEREAKAVAALRHPNIVTIYSVEQAEGLYFYTMELVEGEPLSRLIAPGGSPFDKVLEIALPLVAAVAAAHERGIIHRDLKPGNIMVGPENGLKILDFGLARILGPISPLAGNGMTMTSISEDDGSGTIGYMSPEQIRGEPLDHRSDIFSLGVVLFEVATGELPFPGENAGDLIASILKDEPRRAAALNPGLPASIDGFFRRCLEKDPRYRMATARDLRAELERLGRTARDAPAAAEQPSIAVLPFADMSREKDQAYFCEGVAEEIINALCRVRSLRVASRTASFQCGSTGDPREIGRRLRVGTLLEGSVRKSGNRLRITAQIVDTERGFHIWSESFDRDPEDVFAIQEEIARAVVEALQISLSPKENGELGRPATRHAQAYDYYLRGRSYYYRYGKQDIEFALQLFSRAAELDPGFAPAHAGAADCWSYIYLYAERKDSVREQADAASRLAVELAPDAARAQASRAVALSIGGSDEEALACFEKAIRLDPGLWEAWYFFARHWFVRGHSEEAVRLFEQAGRVRPDDYQAPLLSAQIYDSLGRPEEARRSRRRGVDLVTERLELHPDDSRALYMGANGLVGLGDRDKGLAWARRAREIAPHEPMLLYNLGCIYAMAGEPGEALDCLEQAVSLGLTQKGWFENDSNLDSLRSLPRFQSLMDALSDPPGS